MNMKKRYRKDTKVIKVESEEKLEKIKKVSSYIQNGNVVVIPTDTLYGLATDPFNIESVKRIFQIKRRPLEKPIPLLISDKVSINKYVETNTIANKLIRCFWPGKLTIVFRMKEKSSIPSIVTAGSRKLALRMPENIITLKIISCAGGIVTGTSANISGKSPPSSILDLDKEIIDKVDLIVDNGRLLGKPSTVVDITEDKPNILRIGAITKHEIYRCLNL